MSKLISEGKPRARYAGAAWRRSTGTFFGNPLSRGLFSLALALTIVTTPFQFAWETQDRVGWRAADPFDRSSFDLLPPEYSRVPKRELIEIEGGIPITRFEGPSEKPTEETTERGDRGALLADDGGRPDTVYAVRASRVSEMQVLQFAEVQPAIIGGLNSLYLRIQYPKAAQEAGIQGRVVLSFIVDEDGRTSDVRVIESLHPLCDKAAVDAVEATLFTPARQQGKRVKVRMHLPIRFVLIDGRAGRFNRAGSEGG